jgi:sialic acid synthase SpsE
MISGVFGINGITVSNGSQTTIPYIPGNAHSTAPGNQGEIRIINNSIHVCANGAWIHVNSGLPTISLTAEIQEVLDWARQAMRRDQELEKLVAQYPSVKTAKDNLDVMIALTRDYSKD